jgi:hypothetical protein
MIEVGSLPSIARLLPDAGEKAEAGLLRVCVVAGQPVVQHPNKRSPITILSEELKCAW